MNVERILQLADIIEVQPHMTDEDPEGFTMMDYIHDCGSPACIAGWAVATFSDSDILKRYAEGCSPIGIRPHNEGARVLEISAIVLRAL